MIIPSMRVGIPLIRAKNMKLLKFCLYAETDVEIKSTSFPGSGSIWSL